MKKVFLIASASLLGLLLLLGFQYLKTSGKVAQPVTLLDTPLDPTLAKGVEVMSYFNATSETTAYQLWVMAPHEFPVKPYQVDLIKKADGTTVKSLQLEKTTALYTCMQDKDAHEMGVSYITNEWMTQKREEADSLDSYRIKVYFKDYQQRVVSGEFKIMGLCSQMSDTNTIVNSEPVEPVPNDNSTSD